MFIFALIYALFPLLPVTAVAMWSGVLFKSYQGDSHGKVREIAARCLGLFLAAPLLILYFAELALFTFFSSSKLTPELAMKIAFVASLVLLFIGLCVWLVIRSKGWTLETGQQSEDAFLLKSWRLTAICSSIATLLIILLPITISRLYQALES